MPKREVSFSYLVVMVFLLNGCAATLDALQKPPVRVFYATDRYRTGKADPDKFYGHQRGELTYGTCEVTIPSVHSVSELESPVIRSDPGRHIVLSRVTPESEEAYYANLARLLQNTDQKHAIIYVHGYNTSFDEACRIMAQIISDLDFVGPAVFYSWPSQSSLGAYADDEASVALSEKNLPGFLESFAERSGAKKIMLIAHSMGNRAICGAFATLAERRPDLGKKFSELILAAPDIDVLNFRQNIAPAITGRGPRVTLYASFHDKALDVSKGLHNGNQRIGDMSGGPVIVPGIETIDATDVDASFLGHSYYNSSRSVLSDLFYLIAKGFRAYDRFSLEPVDTPEGRYWKFKK